MRRTVRRRARRNPQFLGAFNMPPLKSIAYVGAGLVIPPMVATQIMKYLPLEYQGSKPVFYAVKAASVFLPSMLVKKFVSREAGNLLLIGGLASFAIDLLKETGILTTLGLSGYNAQPMLGQYPSMSRRAVGAGGLGKYPMMAAGAALNAPRNVYQTPMISDIPNRVNPDARF